MVGKLDSHNQPASLATEIGKRQAFTCPQQEAYLNLVRTHEQLTGEFARLFRQYGISDPQYNALRILQGEGRPLQIYQIAERMVSPQTDISRLIERLVATGLVQRERCQQDRRVVWVKLTATGRTLLRKLADPVKRLHQSQFGSLKTAELRELSRLLFQARQPS
jgi:DNA-binding MarR family transcriptional regulator